MNEVISIIEKRLNRSLDPVELQIINKWIHIDRYPEEYVIYSIPNNDFTLSYLDGLLKRNIFKPMKSSDMIYTKSPALLEFWNSLK